MSNERTDEFLSWRGRLDQPDALPEQRLDNHEASWQRLAARLRERPRRRLTGYWVAAACLLLTLIPAVRFFHPRPSATALRPPARLRTLVQKVAAKPPIPVVGTLPPVVNHHRSPAPILLAIPRAELPLLSSAVPSNGLFSNGLSPDLIIGPTAPPAITAPDIKPATDSHQMMALLPAPKKQLKVVYYNEIGNPSAPSPSTAARTPGFLTIGIERFGGLAATDDPVAQPDNDPILTIKLIPQNH